MHPRYDARSLVDVYLLCFDRKIGNQHNPRGQAGHYIGWTRRGQVAERFAAHIAGAGAHITAAAVAAGITIHIAQIWEGVPLATEKQLKARKAAPRFCPRCRGQAELPLIWHAETIEDFEDFAPVPAARDRIDWLELAIMRSWRRAAPVAARDDAGADIPY